MVICLPYVDTQTSVRRIRSTTKHVCHVMTKGPEVSELFSLMDDSKCQEVACVSHIPTLYYEVAKLQEQKQSHCKMVSS